MEKKLSSNPDREFMEAVSPNAEVRGGGTPSSVPLGSALRWDDPKWWPARCPECGWEGMSNECAGGNEIADTGDFDDPVCPKCCHSGEGQFMGRWIPVVEIPPPNAKDNGRETAKENV